MGILISIEKKGGKKKGGGGRGRPLYSAAPEKGGRGREGRKADVIDRAADDRRGKRREGEGESARRLIPRERGGEGKRSQNPPIGSLGGGEEIPRLGFCYRQDRKRKGEKGKRPSLEKRRIETVASNEFGGKRKNWRVRR